MKMNVLGMGTATPLGGTAELVSALTAPTDCQPAVFTTDTSDLTTYIPLRKLRRIDHFTRMALLGAYRALEDAKALSSPPESMGIIVSSGYGPSQTTFDFLDSIIDDGPHLASPLAFSHSVHNIPTGILSMFLGRPCPQTTICQLAGPVIAGLCTAALWLTEGRVDSVLFGALDESTPLLIKNTKRLAQERGQAVQPVGEGSAFFLLSHANTSGIKLELNPSPSPKEAFTLPLPWGAIPVATAFDLAAAIQTIKRDPQAKFCKEGTNWIRVSGNEHA